MANQLKEKANHARSLIARMKAKDAISEQDLNREVVLLLEWIRFFQHERLIHLIVTVLFALLTMGSFALYLLTQFVLVIAVFVLFLALLIPYIFHYYRLENGVQGLYGIYEELLTLKEEIYGKDDGNV